MSTAATPAIRERTLSTASGLLMRVSEPASPEHPPLLLIPGLGAGAWAFSKYISYFTRRGYPVFALEPRGRSESRKTANIGAVSIEDYAGDALEAARMLGRPAVIGHSMGGLLAQRLAAADAVRAAVLLCSAPPRGISIVSFELLRRQLRHGWTMLASRPLAGAPGDHERLTLNRMPASERARINQQLIPDSGRAAREISLFGVAVSAAAIRCPMISVVGLDDRFIPPRVGRKIAARYHIPCWEYSDHAHFIVAEPGWESPASDIAHWLEHMDSLGGLEAHYESLWIQLQRSIGENVWLRFYDGREVEAEIVNVDLARQQDVIYELRRVRDAGTGSMRHPAVGEVGRSWLYELTSIRAPVSG